MSDQSGIAFIGDVMLGRNVGTTTTPLELQQALEQAADGRVLAVNLECVITESRQPAAHTHSAFAAAPALLKALQRAGTLVASVANNHCLDFGAVGLADTLAALHRTRIAALGIRREAGSIEPECMTLGARRLAIFGCCDLSLPAAVWKAGIVSARDAGLHAAIATHVSRGEDVVVSVHWGHEGITVPPPEARQLARRFAALGVRVVIGHGPHVVQGFEDIGTCRVYYSLGDAVFDRAAQTHRDWGLLVYLDATPQRLVTRHRIVQIDARTYVPTAVDAAHFEASLEERSAVLQDDKVYRARFAAEAGSGFVGQQIRSTWRLVRRAGWRGLVAKARGFRLRHLRLFAYAIRATRRP